MKAFTDDGKTMAEIFRIKEIARKQCELMTERLTMRPFRTDDGAMMYALNEGPEVLQYTGDVQFTDVVAASAFLRDYDQYEKYGVGQLRFVEPGFSHPIYR